MKYYLNRAAFTTATTTVLFVGIALEAPPVEAAHLVLTPTGFESPVMEDFTPSAEFNQVSSLSGWISDPLELPSFNLLEASRFSESLDQVQLSITPLSEPATAFSLLALGALGVSSALNIPVWRNLKRRILFMRRRSRVNLKTLPAQVYLIAATFVFLCATLTLISAIVAYGLLEAGFKRVFSGKTRVRL